MLFSQRQKLAKAVEQRMRKAEREMDGVTFTRCHFNTISQLEQMGYLRDRPQRPEPASKVI